jgi:hypothetical protein
MKKVIAFVLLLSGLALGQSGTSVPDSVAYRMLFIRLSHNQQFARGFTGEIGLSQPDKNALAASVGTFGDDYQNQVISPYSTNPSQAIAARESLVTSARTYQSANMTAAGLSALDAYVQNTVKTNTTVTPDGNLTAYFADDPGGDVNVCYYGSNCYSPDIGAFAGSEFMLDGGGVPCPQIQNTVYTFNGGNVWQSFGTAAVAFTQISIGQSGTMFALTSGGHIYSFNPTSRNFDLQAGSMTLNQISVGDGPTVWGTKLNGQVYSYDVVSNVWTLRPGTLSQVSVSPDGLHIWGVNSTHSIYNWNGSAWIQIPGSAKYIAAGNNTYLGNYLAARIIGTDDKIYKYQPDGSWFNVIPTAPAFKSIGSPLPLISDTFYGVKADNSLYKCSTAGGCSLVSGHASLSVTQGTAQDIYTLDTAGHVQRFLPTVTSSWKDSLNENAYNNVIHTQTVSNLGFTNNYEQDFTTTTLSGGCSPINASWRDYIQFAFTRSFNDAHGIPGQFCHYTGATYVCDWPLEPWCTLATTPPNFMPLTLEIDQNIGPTVWATDGNGVCGRLDPSHPWYCVPTGAPVFTYTVNLPHAADCTKNP